MYFTVKPQEGIVATSFKPGDKVFIGGDKLLPLEKYVALFFIHLNLPLLTNSLRFLPKPKPPPGTNPNFLLSISRFYLTYSQVPPSRRGAVSPNLALVVVQEADEVLPAVAGAVLPVDAEDLEVVEEVLPVAEASREAAAAEVVEALAADSRQSLSYLLLLSYYGVWGNWELLQETFCPFVHTRKSVGCFCVKAIEHTGH